MNKYCQRIESLRALMASHAWDAVILTGSDPHQSEYPAPRWKQVQWLTGFTGEAGDVVVTMDHAGLWTDSRYFIQAVSQLEGTSVELHKTRVPQEVPIQEWLRRTFPSGAVVAIDSLCYSAEDYCALRSRFDVALVPDILSSCATPSFPDPCANPASAGSADLQTPAALLWEDRPGIPQTPVFRVQSGESLSDKLDWLRSEISEAGACAALITSLDEIAWLLNVRASDIEYNPLVISYLLVLPHGARWFILKGEIEDPATEICFADLEEQGIEILPYDSITAELSFMDGPLAVDFSSLNAELYGQIRCEIKPWASPVQLRKACKNAFEAEAMRSAHIDDGVAMECFLYWLERSLDSGKEISEWDAAVKLGQYRARIHDYRGDSFETISAYGPGAALPHYITPKTDAPILRQRGLYLVDSGGQYLRGTTDITRTIPLGDCTPQEIQHYTLVLKGHIALAMAKFPAGTPGCRLDVLAREPLWNAGLNFGHGTGHGVGFFLGCHEGPADIRQNLNSTPLMEGMILSDEPGLYVEGSHGVRHENLLMVVPACTTEFGTFLRFQPLTLCHFDTSILDWSLLSPDEAQWLKDYNQRVYTELSPLLPPEVSAWLASKLR